MNILYVTGLFAKSRREKIQSGMPKAVLMNAAGMKKRGHTVSILTADSVNRIWNYEGIRIISVCSSTWRLKDKDIYKAAAIVTRELRIQKAIREILKTEKIDVIQYTGWFGVGLFHSKIPSVMRVSSYTKAQLSSCYSQQTVKLLSFFERCAARRMNAIYAPSNIMAKALEDDIHRKVYVIETPFVKEDLEEDDFLLNQQLSGKRYVLFFGRMSEDKGIGLIRDCVYDVLKAYRDIYFVFAGTAEKDICSEILSAAREYKKRIIFLGSVSHEKLYPVIRKAEIILMPSLKDNFPNACAEALSLHKIVIGSENSSLEQFITDGYNGFLIQNGSAESLKNKIEYVFQLSEKDKEGICNRTQEKIRDLDPEKYFKTVENMMKRIQVKERQT
ncbi:MAG: glycosyltransferase family 4 protein [Lachnospiraceae bacterium]|nr:glycosyltransferase family 4 protein [Lachnospiraceae bacterium]